MEFSEHLLKLRKSRYERGHCEPQMSTLIALADFYSLSLDELVCRDWPKEPET